MKRLTILNFKMKENIFLDEQEVNSFLIDDERCTKYMLEEVIRTLRHIATKKGRRWVFNSSWEAYTIDEYNEYNDFVMTYKFKL